MKGTIITADHKVPNISYGAMTTILQNVEGTIYTTYEVYDSLSSIGIDVKNRPYSFLRALIEHDMISKVIQVEYSKKKSELVEVAESMNLDVILLLYR